MPASILVIDGDAASRNYLSAMLTQRGCTVLSAALGKEGLIAAWRDRPDIIIFDPALSDLDGTELVSRLRQDRRTSEIPLIALSSRENPQEMTSLLGAGCGEYLVKSAQGLQKLIGLLPGGISEQVQQPAPAKQARLIVFLSAKGGTGTSSLCANIAMCSASYKTGLKVGVMDLVLPLGSIANIVGYNGRLNLFTLAMRDPGTTPATDENYLPYVQGWNFHLMAGVPDPELANRLTGEQIGEILGTMMTVYDLVFVDLGRSLSRISMPVILKADVIVLILSTDYATADLTLRVLEHLKAQHVDLQHVYVIQNRAIGLEGMAKEDLERRIGLPIGVTMPYMGDNFTVANNRHEPVAIRFQGTPAFLTLEKAAMEMVDLALQE